MAAGGQSVTIYALCDPDTLERRYVGKAIDLASRLRCHRCERRGAKIQTHKANWLRSLGSREPAVVILAEVDHDGWESAERNWIAESRRLGHRLTNFADGGQTSPVEGKVHTDAAKEKMRQAALRNGSKPPSRKGMKSSDETKRKLSEAAAKRGAAPPNSGGWNKGTKKTICQSGHEYTPENTRTCYRRGRSYQICRTCDARNMKKYLNRQKGV